MKERRITEADVERFRKEMMENEKAEATIKKYVREAECLKNFLNGSCLTKEILLKYRDRLIKKLSGADGQRKTVCSQWIS